MTNNNPELASQPRESNKATLIFAIFIGLFILFLQASRAYSEGNLNTQLASIQQQMPFVLLPTTTPTRQPTNTPRPTRKPSKTPTPTTAIVRQKPAQQQVDPDPPVHCPIHEKCGGGTVPLKRSECDNMVCCGPNGQQSKWLTKQECESWRNSTEGGGSAPVGNEKVAVNPFGNRIFYCPPSSVESVKELGRVIQKLFDETQAISSSDTGCIAFGQNLCEINNNLAYAYINQIEAMCNWIGIQNW